jgi:hypothetical protein
MHRMIALWVAVAGCGASTLTEKPGPRGLRADQHLAIASREDTRAGELATWPDTRPGPVGGSTGMLATQTWFGTWDTVAEHQRMGRHHRSQAAELEAAYEEACGTTSAELAARSPLERFGVGGNPVEGGMVVLLSPEAGPPDQLLAAMRCHRAWMMLGRSNMADCPLDLPGIKVSARGDATGIELTITVADPALVPELRRRAAHDLEGGHAVH